MTLNDNTEELRLILNEVNALPQAGSDTSSDNPAESSDIAAGKEAFVNDKPVTGTVPVQEAGTCVFNNDTFLDVSWGDEELSVEFEIQEERLARHGSLSAVCVPASRFGDAEQKDVPQGKTFTSGKAGLKKEGTLLEIKADECDTWGDAGESVYEEEGQVYVDYSVMHDKLARKNSKGYVFITPTLFGNAKREQVAKGVFFTSSDGVYVEGTGLVAGGGGSVFPDGAFAPVTSFTDGKQYALVSTINGTKRYINTTEYNQYTMNATEVSISEDAGDYVIFSATPVLFTAVASGNGFLLQNGSNYLHGTTNNGTALRFGTTQAVWTIDTSATGGFSDGKYHAKEDSNAVWLKCNDGSYNWSIKFESAGSFGYDRDGRDNTYSTGFTPFVLYEYVAGEGDVNPIMDTSEGNLSANKMLEGSIGFSNGRRVEGNIKSQGAQTITPSTSENHIEPGVYLSGRQTIAAIQTETGSATQNGTYNPSNGKYFSSFTVNVPSGPAGYTITTGTLTGASSVANVNTGLSKIKEFFIYKESVSATGLINLHYSDTDGTSYIYASQWSSSSFMSSSKTITAGTGSATVSGGTLTFPSTSPTSGGLTASTTYTWVAIGEE